MNAVQTLKISIRDELLKCYEEEPTRGPRMSAFFQLLKSLNVGPGEQLFERVCHPQPVNDAKEALRLLRKIAPMHMDKHLDETLLCV